LEALNWFVCFGIEFSRWRAAGGEKEAACDFLLSRVVRLSATTKFTLMFLKKEKNNEGNHL
jgi:hypothetical protein